jgi:hypothetical protein
MEFNIPGFTAEDSLYPSSGRYSATATCLHQRHDLHRASAVQQSVVPQLPIRLGRVCGPCIGGFGLGFRECADFSCDLQKFECDYGEPSIEDC